MYFFDDYGTHESLLPHMSSEMAKNILHLNKTIIKFTFFDILSDDEIDALADRLQVIKKEAIL